MSSIINNNHDIYAISIILLLIMVVSFLIFIVVYACIKDPDVLMTIILLIYIATASFVCCTV